MPVFDPVQLIAAIKTLLPIVPWLQRSNLEYEEKKKELEKIRQKLVQDIGEAVNRSGKDASVPELVTSQAALESIEQLIKEGRKQNASDNG